MAIIITRAGKGSSLTNNELDSNFTNLNDDIATRLLATSYSASDVLAKLLTVDGSGSGLDADTLDGLDSSSAATANTVVVRDASGNITVNQVTGTATKATNVVGGEVNKIVYQTGADASGFVDAPVDTGHILEWTGAGFNWGFYGGSVTKDILVKPDDYGSDWIGNNTAATKSDLHKVMSGVVDSKTTTGTAPTFALTPDAAALAYTVGQKFRVTFHTAGTGTDTLNVSGLGTKSIKQYNSLGVKESAVIKTGQISLLEYDGTDFLILNPLPSPSLGENQTWQQLTGSRSLGVTYTNTTGRTIVASVGGTGQPNHCRMRCTVDGVILGDQGVISVASAAMLVQITAIIPNGSTYGFTNILGCTLFSWAELR